MDSQYLHSPTTQLSLPRNGSKQTPKASSTGEVYLDQVGAHKVEGSREVRTDLWLTTEANQGKSVRQNQAAAMAIIIITWASLMAYTAVPSVPKLAESMTPADKTNWVLFIVLMILILLLLVLSNETYTEDHVLVKIWVMWVTLLLVTVALVVLALPEQAHGIDHAPDAAQT